MALYIRVRGPERRRAGHGRGRADRHGRRHADHSPRARLDAAARAVRAADAARCTGDLVRRRDVRALARCARRGERRQGRVHDGVRRAPPRALHEGRGHAPNRRSRTSDRNPQRLDLERPGARDRCRPRHQRPDRRLHDRQRRLVARHRGRQSPLPPAGEDLRRSVLVRTGGLRPGRTTSTTSTSRCA